MVNENKTHTRFGFYVSLFTAIITILTFTIAFLTPPLSGPFCVADCFGYPYHDIVSRFPRDYYWMYPAMLISILFVIFIINIHFLADSNKKMFSLIGAAFSVVAAAILIPNYFVQVSVVQPSLLNGETDGIALITQFNPNGLFIALEEIGFLLMNITFFVIIPVFSSNSRIERSIQWLYFIGLLLALFSYVFISVKLGVERGYIFEVAIISIVWLELIISSILLTIVFNKKSKMKQTIRQIGASYSPFIRQVV